MALPNPPGMDPAERLARRKAEAAQRTAEKRAETEARIAEPMAELRVARRRLAAFDRSPERVALVEAFRAARERVAIARRGGEPVPSQAEVLRRLRADYLRQRESQRA